MNPSLIGIALASALFMGGCAVVPRVTQSALSQLDPLTADPAGFVLFADLPTGIEIRQDKAVLKLSGERSDTGEVINGRYVLETELRQDGTQTYRIAASDLDRLRRDQARAAEWERVAPDQTTGSLEVDVSGCVSGEGPAPDARLNIGLQIVEGGPVLPLLRNVHAAQFLEDPLENATTPTCN